MIQQEPNKDKFTIIPLSGKILQRPPYTAFGAISAVIIVVCLTYFVFGGVKQPAPYDTSSVTIPRKTLKDSVFKKGDIIRIPTLYINGDGWLIVKGIPTARRAEEQIDYTDSILAITNFIKAHKNFVFELSFHFSPTDEDSYSHSLEISEGFAKKTVSAFINDFGVDTKQLVAKGYGKLLPLSSDKEISKSKTKAEKDRIVKINRRNELKILEIK